jgi:NRPS condensation-like uncharacterized protein
LRRALSNLERAFWLIDRAARFNLVWSARVRGNLDSAHLRRALDALQACHPLLRVHIESDGEVVFESEGTPAIPLHTLTRQGDDHWRQVAVDELRQPMPTREGPLVRVVHLESPGLNDVVVSFHHCIADGVSAVSFVRRMLEAVDELARGGSPTLPPLTALAPQEQLLPASSRRIGARWRAIRRLAAQLISMVIACPQKLPPDLGAPLEQQFTQVIHRSLGPPELNRLLQRCRQEKCSIHGALCAALLESVAAQMGGSRAAKMVCVSPINLRRLLEPPVGDDHMGNYIGGVFSTHRIDGNVGFWDLGRAVQARITADKSSGEACSSVALRSALSFRFLSPERATRLLDSPVWGAVGVTNVGVVEAPKQAGGLRLEGLQVVGPATPYGTVIYLAVNTFAGSASLNFSYTEPLVSGERALAIVEDTMNRLRAESIAASAADASQQPGQAGAKQADA